MSALQRSKLGHALKRGSARIAREVELTRNFVPIAVAALKKDIENPFPIQVFPRAIQNYIDAWAASIFCRHDLIALPLLGVAGAATGRSGRRLLVKPGYAESSCLWVVCLAASSDGKSPAMNAACNFYLDRQREENRKWLEIKNAHKQDPKNNPDPGFQPQLFLTDTTTEALRHVLTSGPTLYQSDELSGWCHQFSQYKSNNADKPAWTSFWSHAPVSIGRRCDSLSVDAPFVSVVGMLVPGSAHELNYRGHDDDGFVHRMLIAYPKTSCMVFCPTGVPEELTATYKECMAKLFDPGGQVTVDPKAFNSASVWCNQVHYAEVGGRAAPDWLKAKYKKLFANLWRVALVLHEIRRVAETEDERSTDFDPSVVDAETVERAIKVITYFKDHIYTVQNLLGDEPTDKIEGLYQRFSNRESITVRDFMLSTSYKKADTVKSIFAQFEKRGYGSMSVGKRRDQVVFNFGSPTVTDS